MTDVLQEDDFGSNGTFDVDRIDSDRMLLRPHSMTAAIRVGEAPGVIRRLSVAGACQCYSKVPVFQGQPMSGSGSTTSKGLVLE